jgi:hypothetical protein
MTRAVLVGMLIAAVLVSAPACKKKEEPKKAETPAAQPKEPAPSPAKPQT